jgi:hypothetical protein
MISGTFRVVAVAPVFSAMWWIDPAKRFLNSIGRGRRNQRPLAAARLSFIDRSRTRSNRVHPISNQRPTAPVRAWPGHDYDKKKGIIPGCN